MLLRTRSLLAALLICSFSSPAYASLQDTSASLSPGSFDLGIEFQWGYIGQWQTVDTPASLMLHEAIGLANGLDLQLAEGFGLDAHEVYLGGAVKWTVLKDAKDRPGVALYFGGHYITNAGYAGVDVTAIVDHRFKRVNPYLGLRFNVEFGHDDTDAYLGILGGARIALHRRVGWFVEGGLGFFGPPRSNYIATGPRINI